MTEVEGTAQTQDPWVVRVLEEHGLDPSATVIEIEPVARELWPSMPKRLTCLEMLLGREITSDEIKSNQVLGGLILTDSFDRAFALANLYKHSETNRVPASDQ